MANGRGESHIVAEFSKGVMHVGPPVEAHAVGGDPGAVSDLGMCNSSSNKQEVEAVSGREGKHVEKEVGDDPFVDVQEVGAEFLDKGRDVKFTLGVHRGVGLFTELPHNGGSVKAYTRHDGGSRKRRVILFCC